MKRRRAAKYDDADSNIDPDDQLETLLEALKDSDRSLGELRRDFGLAPELVVRLLAKYPKLIGEDPVNEKVRILPGITTTLERVRQQKTSSTCQPSPSMRLEADRDRLLRLLVDAPRHSSWLSEGFNLPIERIREIGQKWPAFGIVIAANDLGQKHQFIVSLARPLDPPLPEVVVEEPPAPPPPAERVALLSDLPEEMLKRMAWRPGRPQMSSGRRANSQNMMYRRRSPLPS